MTTRIVTFEQVFDKGCFPSRILPQKHDHRFCIKVAIRLPRERKFGKRMGITLDNKLSAGNITMRTENEEGF